ncbi:MAG: hypothetical protein GY714_31880 [Desulfobacterales bacterium]|nr:hypothetical protein [Desulfobacterales bacterium]
MKKAQISILVFVFMFFISGIALADDLNVDGKLTVSDETKIVGGSDVTLEKGGMVIIGNEKLNVAIDSNEIMARKKDNGVSKPAFLGIQSEGGSIGIHNQISLFPELKGTEIRIAYDGDVSIGHSSPRAKLHVLSLIDADAKLEKGGLIIAGDMKKHNITIDENEIMARNNGNASPIYLQADGGSFRIHNNMDVSSRFIVENNGNVGIGTINPGDYKLAVKGKIRAEEIVVETGWADYVFENDYILKPLSEVETFIKKNKHLPEVPPAKQIKKDGLSMSEMMAIQMKKIEELTLYLIEQNKKTLEQNKQITGLIEKNETLQAQLNLILKNKR